MEKEDILISELEKHLGVPIGADRKTFLSLKETQPLLIAMSEWAKQDGIGFAEFISGNGWEQYDGADRWICPTERSNVVTTAQLYDLYKQSKTNK